MSHCLPVNWSIITKITWNITAAEVPSNDLFDPGHLVDPYFDPTTAAAVSPIPKERTPLRTAGGISKKHFNVGYF